MTLVATQLHCLHGCIYPVIDGIPIMLIDEAVPTFDPLRETLRCSHENSHNDPYFLDTLGISLNEKSCIQNLIQENKNHAIDPVASYLIAATNGIAYQHLVGKVTEYPIPELPIQPSIGKMFLDIGCSWGRWCIAASRKGFEVIGIDPSLGAVLAARRVAEQLGVKANFIVGDARHLPFQANKFDQVFSYSVLQHFSPNDVATSLESINRILKISGQAVIQMPTKLGIRCIQQQLRRGFRRPTGFEVRYWLLSELRHLFESKIGKTAFSVDCFFGIGLQFSDIKHMTFPLRQVVRTSEALRHISQWCPSLKYIADSVYVHSIKIIT